MTTKALLSGVLATFLLVGCSGEGSSRRADSSGTPSAPPAPAPNDVRELGDFMPASHANLDALVGRGEWESEILESIDRTASGEEDEVLVELMRLAALPSASSGGDGHSGIFPLDSHDRTLHLFPIRLYLFSDGLYVVDAPTPLKALVGAELSAIEGRGVAELIKMVEPLVPRDNEMTVRARLPQYLVTAEVLRGLGVLADSSSASFEFRRDDDIWTEDIGSISADMYSSRMNVWHPMIPSSLPPGGDPLYLRNADEASWTTMIESENVLYVQYNVTLDSSSELGDEILGVAEREEPKGIVLDLRHNPGGENSAADGLRDALESPKLRGVPLYVLVGRSSFSAAGVLSLKLQRSVDPIFAGEPTGFSTRFFGDPVPTSLPSGFRVNAGGVLWNVSGDGELDQPLMPQIERALSSADYFQGRDPALEAVLRHLK